MEPDALVANKDVPVAVLQNKILSAKSPEEKEKSEKKLDEIMQGRELVRDSMHKIVEKCTDSPQGAERIFSKKSKAYTTREYKEVVEYYKVKCFDWHDTKYQTAMQHLYLFANLLEERVAVERIKGAIDEVGATMREDKKLKKDKMEAATSTHTQT